MIRTGYRWTTRPPAGTPLDTSHPLYEGLLWYPDLSSGPFTAPLDSAGDPILVPGLFDPVSGKFGTPASSGVAPTTLCKPTAKGLAFGTGTAGTVDLAAWPQSKAMQTIQKAFSLGGWYRIAAVGSTGSGCLISVPWAAGTWVAPFASLTLQGNGTGTDGAIVYSYGSGAGSTENFVLAGSGFMQIDGQWHHYVGTRQGLVGKFYLDGKLITTANFASDNVVNMNGAGTPQPIVIMNRSSTSTANQGFVGECLNAGIWNRCLSDGEIKQLHREPFTLYAPPRARVWMQILPTPKADSDSGTVSEAAAVTQFYTDTDAATAAATASLVESLAQADSAAAALAASLAAEVGQADAATAGAAATLEQVLDVPTDDTGTGGEAAAVAVALAQSDAAVASGSASVFVVVPRVYPSDLNAVAVLVAGLPSDRNTVAERLTAEADEFLSAPYLADTIPDPLKTEATLA